MAPVCLEVKTDLTGSRGEQEKNDHPQPPHITELQWRIEAGQGRKRAFEPYVQGGSPEKKIGRE